MLSAPRGNSRRQNPSPIGSANVMSNTISVFQIGGVPQCVLFGQKRARDFLAVQTFVEVMNVPSHRRTCPLHLTGPTDPRIVHLRSEFLLVSRPMNFRPWSNGAHQAARGGARQDRNRPFSWMRTRWQHARWHVAKYAVSRKRQQADPEPSERGSRRKSAARKITE